MYGEQDVLQRVLAAPRRVNVAVILLGGGHFAAAVFKGIAFYLFYFIFIFYSPPRDGGSEILYFGILYLKWRWDEEEKREERWQG